VIGVQMEDTASRYG